MRVITCATPTSGVTSSRAPGGKMLLSRPPPPPYLSMSNPSFATGGSGGLEDRLSSPSGVRAESGRWLANYIFGAYVAKYFIHWKWFLDIACKLSSISTHSNCLMYQVKNNCQKVALDAPTHGQHLGTRDSDVSQSFRSANKSRRSDCSRTVTVDRSLDLDCSCMEIISNGPSIYQNYIYIFSILAARRPLPGWRPEAAASTASRSYATDTDYTEFISHWPLDQQTPLDYNHKP